MGKILFTVKYRGDSPTIAHIKAKYGLKDGEIAEDYGPERGGKSGEYVVKVEEIIAYRIQGTQAETTCLEDSDERDDMPRAYSDVRIETMGPPQI